MAGFAHFSGRENLRDLALFPLGANVSGGLCQDHPGIGRNQIGANAHTVLKHLSHIETNLCNLERGESARQLSRSLLRKLASVDSRDDVPGARFH